jgi:NAD(P)-dependent dehydrogenase (short-subunit alcohol dehydrogenase family)
MRMPDLTGKVAIVTGAATGIGAATSHTLARYGASVVVAGHRLDGAESVAKEIRADGGIAVGTGVDVTEEEQVAAMVQVAVSEFGGLDALHNNAAGTRMDAMGSDLDVVNVGTSVWDLSMSINLRGPFFGCKYAIPEMLKRGGGTIVNTSSAAGLAAERTRVSYGVSKAGLHALTRHVANAYGKQNIRCNALALGLILTKKAQQTMTPPMLEKLLEHNALGRLGSTDDVAEMVAFLFSDLGSFVTGTVIPLDGGFTSHLPVLVDAE